MDDHAAKPPEVHAMLVHLAPGAGPLSGLAEAVGGISAQLSGILGGHQANAGALTSAWISPASALDAAADSAHRAWVGDVAAQIGTAGIQIGVVAAAFEAAKAAIPTPAEIEAVQSAYPVLLATNVFGINTVPIILNRLDYFGMWIRAAIAMFIYDAASAAATVGLIPPLPAPPPGLTAGADDPLTAVEQAVQQPAQLVMGGVESLWSAVQGPLNAIAPFAMPVGMGLLSAAPMAMAVPMMAMSAGMHLGGGGGLAGASAPAGQIANVGGWMGAAPEPGGAVAARISPGGAGGGADSTATAMAPLRSPGSWASGSTAAAPAAESDTGQVPSRIGEAREALTRPATSAGMGTPGVMPPPALRGSESGQAQQRNSPLAAAAALYRESTQIPVITGAGGAQFMAGKEDG